MKNLIGMSIKKMSKNIFDEALKEISYATIDLEDLEIIVNYDVDKIEKALKLGSLYKKYFTIVHKLQVMELSELALNHNYYQIEIMKIEAKIKELENENIS